MAEETFEKETTLGKVFNKCEEVVLTKLSDSVSDEKIEGTIRCLEDLTREVCVLCLFSENEVLKELPTSSLPFLLLPAYLGFLTHNSSHEDRKRILEIAETYYTDFVQRLKDYEVLPVEMSRFVHISPTTSNATSTSHPVAALESERKLRVERFKEQKALWSKLEALKERKRNKNYVDEEDERDLYVTQINWWALRAVDELDSISKEKPMVEHMLKLKNEGSSSVPVSQPVTKLKPVILTRTDVQKQVYGAGYPSLPTMTVDEWFEQIYAPQLACASAASSTGTGAESGDAVEEEKETEESVAKARAQDDYKDTHRTGWGNTYNKG